MFSFFSSSKCLWKRKWERWWWRLWKRRILNWKILKLGEPQCFDNGLFSFLVVVSLIIFQFNGSPSGWCLGRAHALWSESKIISGEVPRYLMLGFQIYSGFILGNGTKGFINNVHVQFYSFDCVSLFPSGFMMGKIIRKNVLHQQPEWDPDTC